MTTIETPPSIFSIGETTDKWPMLQDLWNFYSEKSTKTVFVSIGSSPSAIPDLEILEQLGCPLFLYDPKKENCSLWDEIKETLKTRKVTEDTNPFVKEALKKWVLARNINSFHTHLGHYNGLIDNTPVTSFINAVTSACKQVGLSEEEARIDFLKIDLKDQEPDLLHYCIQEGFRPSLILVRWSTSPDASHQTTIAAANLQMVGYKLLEKIENKYLYYFMDNNYYESCSWEKTTVDNPLIDAIVESIRNVKIPPPTGILTAKPWPEPNVKDEKKIE